MLSVAALSVGSIFWSLLGYSLAFGPGGEAYWGGLSYGVFDSTDRPREGTQISEHAFFIFQCAFNFVTIAVISGGVVGRIKLWAFSLFSILWTIFVYCPLAHWIFYPQGWLASWGVLDFAGGLVVETASGVSAFILAFWIGPGTTLHGGHGHHPRPHNVPFTVLGALFLLIGWYGFNAGSALAAGYSAGRAFANTHLAAVSGLVTWSLCEVVWSDPDETGKFFKGRPTAIGAATGTIVGLVGITPAAGFVSQMWSLGIGLFCGLTSYWANRLIKKTGVDDRLECLACHGVAGALGTLLTGLMASTAEGSPSDGAFYGNGAQFVKQLAGLGMTLVVCVVGTSGCYWIVWALGRFLFGADVRIADDLQDNIDHVEHGERAYYSNANREKSSYSLFSGFDGPSASSSHHLHQGQSKPLLNAVTEEAGGAAARGSESVGPLEVAASSLDLLAAAVTHSINNNGAPGTPELQLRSVTTRP